MKSELLVMAGQHTAVNTFPGLVHTARLKFAFMKSELLVMAGQHTAVNTFPGLVHTARHTMRVGDTRSL